MRQPKNVWQWLLLLTPAVEILVVALVPRWWADWLFADNDMANLKLMIVNLPVAFLYSMALGLWVAWESPSWASRLTDGILAGIAIVFVNGMMAAAGCTIGATIF